MTFLNDNALPTTAILGVGSMGGAILDGLLAPGAHLSSAVRITTLSAESSEKYQSNDAVIAHSLETDPEANIKAVTGAKIVILGVKPHMILDLIAEISSSLEPGSVLISVAAGIEIASMQAVAPSSVSVVRAMPNTPSFVGKGVTGIVTGPETDVEVIELSRRLFSTVGEVITVDSEQQLNALSAVSGSGPAYVFLFIEKLIEATMRLGFSAEQANVMVQDTFLGASMLLETRGVEPAELRANVTSPNGTTEQAIRSFEGAGLDTIFDEALAAAIHRSEQLASENKR